MQVCRSREFLEYAVPVMRAAFGGAGEGWDVDNIHRLYTRVEPGFIRVDADEITYPAHVVLRYRLERAMIDGDMAVSEDCVQSPAPLRSVAHGRLPCFCLRERARFAALGGQRQSGFQ